MIGRILLLVAAAGLAAPALAETVLAARTIRAQAVIAPEDITIADVVVPGTLQASDTVVGMETRVVLYAGRPIRPGDIGPPAIIDRNAPVLIIFRQGGLTITAEGRALGRAGVGDTVRVMNLSSRNTVSGAVRPDGSVQVGGVIPDEVP
jgi:flagella basal body P-ring formation protein FlgA